MSWIDGLLDAYRATQSGGVALLPRSSLNFVSGAIVVDNPETKTTDVTVTATATGTPDPTPNTIASRDSTGKTAFTGLLSPEISAIPGINAQLYATGDGTTNDAAELEAAFVANNQIAYVAGTYKIGTSVTLGGAGKTHSFARGAMLTIDASTVTLTIDGFIDAPPNQQIFALTNVDATHPGVALGPNTPRRVEAGWFGAKGDGTQDDAPSITNATRTVSQGGTVHFTRAPSGSYSVRSSIVIGSTSADSQGIRWEFDAPNYSPSAFASLIADASLPAGAPMVLIQNTLRFNFGGLDIDANGNADICIQTRSDSLSGRFPSWHTVLRDVTMRNSRVHDFLTGETGFFATCNPSTDTFTATGHPLQNGDVVFLAPHHQLAVLPASAAGSLDELFFVVARATNTFQLSLTLGGSAVDFTTAGVGIWTVEKSLRGDCSALRAEGVQFGGRTVSAAGVAKYCQKGYETFGNSLKGSWFQGEPSPTLTFTANSSTDVLTLSGGTLADGDLVVVYNFTTSDQLPQGAVSAVTHVGTGPTVTIAGTPLDTRGVVLTITVGGARGVAYFTYSIGGNTALGPVVVPTGGTYAVPGTGITATFPAGTYVAADTYSWTVAGGLARGTEYVWSNLTGTTGKLLASIGGSAIDIVTAGSGTFKIQKISADTLCGIRLFEGELTVGATFTGLYKDIYATGVHGSQGWKLHVESGSSQSYQFLHASSRGITMTPQEGGCELDGFAHTGGTFLGCQYSIYWDMPFFSSLLVDGGFWCGDIHIASGANSPVELVRPTLPATALATPDVTGDRTYLHGEWQANTVLKTWEPSLVSQSTITAPGNITTQGQFTAGPDGAAQMFEAVGDGYFVGNGAVNLESGTAGVNIIAGGGNILLLPKTGSGTYAFNDSFNWGSHTEVPCLSASGSSTTDYSWVYTNGCVIDTPTYFQVNANGTQDFLVEAGVGVFIGHAGGVVGAFGSSGSTKPTVTGSKASGAALVSFLAAMVALGWITDSTTT